MARHSEIFGYINNDVVSLSQSYRLGRTILCV